MSLLQDALERAGRISVPEKAREKKTKDATPVTPAKPDPEISETALVDRVEQEKKKELAEEEKGFERLKKFISKQIEAKRLEWQNPEIQSRSVLAGGVLAFLAALWLLFVLSSRHSSSVKKQEHFRIKSTVSVNPASLVSFNTVPEFRLTGITSSAGERLAVLNDQVVAAGDLLPEKARVKEIQDHSVLLDFHGREIKLTL